MGISPIVDVVVPRQAQVWHRLLLERLRQAGYDVTVTIDADAGANQPWLAGPVLSAEGLLLAAAEERLFSTIEIAGTVAAAPPALTVDLSGTASSREPRLALRFAGESTPASVLGRLASGDLPSIEVTLNDAAIVARAAPMIEDRVIMLRAYENVLSRAITVMASTVDSYLADPAVLPREPLTRPREASGSFAANYMRATVPRLALEVARRLRFRYAHWRVGYRLSDAPAVYETGTLGNGWSVLEDDGQRFYADPFPFTWQGRQFVFVEDYPHATRKAVISVSELTEGRLGTPRPVLEEPFHLSYPQVFARDNQIWMLPEGSGGGQLVLYRAVQFPDVWERHAVIINGREIGDASLVEHEGRLWLFATERDGGMGSASDVMVVYHADRLAGPWQPHRANPIAIDRAAARSGGAAIVSGGQLLLPLQDGTHGYGGGLGFSAVTRLDPAAVELTPPRPVTGDTDFPYPQIHTYNRDGRLEVIDGIAAVRRPLFGQ